MGHSTCCVVNCKNNGLNSKYKFYCFPTAQHKTEQRRRWIAAVRRVNSDGTPWIPKRYDTICSAHFIGSKKSEAEASPSYVPSIFPATYGIKPLDHKSSTERHNRFLNRRNFQTKSSISLKQKVMAQLEMNDSNIGVDNVATNQSSIKVYTDGDCQANIFSNGTKSEQTFICNRYIYENGCCHAEVQTNIIDITTKIVVADSNQIEHEQSGSSEEISSDEFVQIEAASSECKDPSNFNGFSSVKTEEQLLDIAGVSFESFKFLLKAVQNNNLDSWKTSAEDALLIFLMKMKTGLTCSAISVLFSVHRTTVSEIFQLLLQVLAAATSDLVFWPEKDVVQRTMPECFYPAYVNTRVIIDCCEFSIEIPADDDKLVHTYSNYGKVFTAKVLLGITPSGFISFKSKVASGQKNDSQIATECGLIDFLEDGDVVLLNEGFPEIRQTIEAKGKQVVLVMPPFLEENIELAIKQGGDTNNNAKVRIHFEKIMDRLRLYQILNHIPKNFFSCIDDIVHMCCVLVNLQPPIISTDDR